MSCRPFSRTQTRITPRHTVKHRVAASPRRIVPPLHVRPRKGRARTLTPPRRGIPTNLTPPRPADCPQQISGLLLHHYKLLMRLYLGELRTGRAPRAHHKHHVPGIGGPVYWSRMRRYGVLASLAAAIAANRPKQPEIRPKHARNWSNSYRFDQFAARRVGIVPILTIFRFIPAAIVYNSPYVYISIQYPTAREDSEFRGDRAGHRRAMLPGAGNLLPWC
jgi:hypothetical protein